MSLSIVIPAKNEALAIGRVLESIRQHVPDAEVIVVDDGSTDDTKLISVGLGAKVISNPYSKGNGAAIKAGARAATGDIIIFMDADGQHNAGTIPRLVEMMANGYDMVVGARGRAAQASRGRALANGIYNRLASWMVGHAVLDLTSGFRAVRRVLFLRYLYLLPNGFSYPTTITMAFFRAGLNVGYLPVDVYERVGKSHIRLLRDGFRFLIIIIKIGTLYSPLKLFIPISFSSFVAGLLWYLHTYLADGRFTNMSALLFVSSVIIFLIGLVSEQVTQLLYSNDGGHRIRSGD
jgi:glycosyltransferase involved in cell wall biosynthesis